MAKGWLILFQSVAPIIVPIGKKNIVSINTTLVKGTEYGFLFIIPTSGVTYIASAIIRIIISAKILCIILVSPVILLTWPIPEAAILITAIKNITEITIKNQ